MSGIISKAAYKIIVILVAVAFVGYFREKIVSDPNISKAFGAIMSQLPFAKLITDNLCKVLQYQTSIPGITASSFMTDLLKLAVMALIQPPVMGILSRIFLPVKIPKNQILATGSRADMEEAYMNGLGYKVKYLLLTVITAPLIAMGAASLTTLVIEFLDKNLGTVGTVALGSLAVLVTSAVSTVLLVAAGYAIGVAILWRLIVTLLGGMTNMCVINALCLLIYIGIYKGVGSQVVGSIVTLILWLIIYDVAMKFMKRVIISL